MPQHRCIWCECSFLNIEKLAAHVIQAHPGGTVDTALGVKKLNFQRRNSNDDGCLRCFCGQRFTLKSAAAPFWEDWSLEHGGELDSWLAHLRRDGGLEAHRDKVVTEALLAFVGGERPKAPFRMKKKISTNRQIDSELSELLEE
jgi:hypothetical protein